MSTQRRIAAKLCDFTSDGSIIVHGSNGENLIVDLGWAQVENLDRAIDRYIEYWKSKTEKPAE